jgi:Trk K+ transport system NAD-binding subunit
MNFENIMEAPWVTDKFDGRAPSLVTVNMEITPMGDTVMNLGDTMIVITDTKTAKQLKELK